MKLQALFSLKDNNKKIKMSSAAIFVWHLMWRSGKVLAGKTFVL